jgi:protein SCO1
MHRPPPLWSIALGLILLGGAVVGFVPHGVASFGGPFALTDQRGATVTDASLRGAPFVVFFGFTRCSTVCPLTMTRLTRLRRALGPDGEALKVLFVSVDPEDSAADVGRWLEAFPLPVVGLTGSRAERARMMDAYRVFSRGTGATTSHSSTLFLLGPSGEPRGTIEPQDSDATALARMRALVR